MSKNIVIVGGGMSGLVTARILAEDPNNSVTIIEKSNEFGGLYTSTKSESGYIFDHGSHTVLDTGVPELDAILFEDFADDEWEIISESLKETLYYRGEHTSNSVCPDIRKLPTDQYAKAVAEFMNLPECTETSDNLEAKLYTTYGKTITEEIFRPIIEKFYSGDFKDLDPDMYKDFLPLGRIIAFDEETTERLKSIPYYDARIAWTDFKNGNSTIKKYFSKRGGVGVWPELIEKKVREMGVTLLSEENIIDLDITNGHVNGVTLESGKTIACDELIWTVPAFALLQAAKIDIPPMSKPQMLFSSIYNFVFDKAFLKDDHWIFNYDKDMRSFRVTLYPNLSAGEPKPAPHHVTVESLNPQPLADPSVLFDTLQQELVTMGIVDPNAQVIEKFCYNAQGPRPIPTKEFKAAQKQHVTLIKENLSNVKLFGRANGNHFMNPLLREIWFDLKNVESDPLQRPVTRAAA